MHVTISELFQPTHPHGVRQPGTRNQGNPEPGFNPRTRTGCDEYRFRGSLSSACFNPRTRTGCDVRWGREAPKFQPTHPHGVRIMGSLLGLVFQPTHPHRVRRVALFDSIILCFNPRTAQGATADMMPYLILLCSTAPARVRRG